MAGIVLTKEEQAALYGLPYMSQLLYVMFLRPRMDLKSGIVGHLPGCGICWQAAHEQLWINAEPGIKGGGPKISKVRRACKHLEKSTEFRPVLAVNRSKGMKLMFYLPLAVLDKSAKNKADTKPTGLNDSLNIALPDRQEVPQNTIDTGFFERDKERGDREREMQGDRGKTAKADTHQYSVYYYIVNTLVPSDFLNKPEPTSVDDFINIFGELGFDYSMISNVAFHLDLQNWVKLKVTRQHLVAAMRLTHKNLKGPPSSLKYYTRVMDSVLRDSRGLGDEDDSSGNKKTSKATGNPSEFIIVHEEQGDVGNTYDASEFECH